MLRILQDGTFERVGGERQVSVDLRVVAATHRNLEQMIPEGRFREDLWYRLSVFPVRLPPLRERIEDIPAMAAHFASRAAERLGAAALAPNRDDLHRLASYPWPGNVRELAAVIERAVILGDGKRLELEQALGPWPVARAPEPKPVPTESPSPVANDLSIDAAMVRHIEAALLRRMAGSRDRSAAARLLNINPHTLRGRMRASGE